MTEQEFDKDDCGKCVWNGGIRSSKTHVSKDTGGLKARVMFGDQQGLCYLDTAYNT